MPRFDFLCTDCESTFEHLLPAGEKTTPKCLKCGSENTEKLLAPPPVIFKGSGFYATDGKKTSAEKTPESSEAEKTTKDTKDDTPKKKEAESAKNKQDKPKTAE